jgi:hypothetical protein
MSDIVITCPHCFEFVIIAELNCGIFRHGVFISNGNQIDPHCSKELCDSYVVNKQIYGCGKPYQIIKENSEYKVIICGYI